MLQVRKLVLAVAAATAFTSSFTYALGLGDLSVKSSLNQPLEAEISLLEVRDLTSIEIKSQLASPEDFSKAGVDRQFFLTGLKFTPVIDATGKKVIRVTSSKPIKEPYLNFLVEVLWPNGRLLREYTLLLDPPLYKPQQVIYSQQPATIAAPTRSQPVSQPPRQPQQQQPVARAAAPAAPASAPAPSRNALQGSEYRVQKNDTLWEIAQRAGNNASVQQTMLAIQDLNPDAFLNGNINRMKSGQVLRLPTDEQIASRTRAQAIAQVSEQTSSWKAGRAAPVAAQRQLDATRRAEAGAAPATVDPSDNLRLVADAPGQSQQASDQGGSGNLKALQDQLAVSKERLDSTVLENEDLSSRVDDLNSQLEKLKRLIELKDNQLAQLQNSMDTPAEPAVAATPVEPDSAIAEDAAAEPAAVENAPIEEAVAETVEDAVEPVADVDDSAAETAADEVAVDDAATNAETDNAIESEQDLAAQLEAEVAADMAAEAAAADDVDAQTAQQVDEALAASQAMAEFDAEEQSMIDQIMNDPMLLAAIGGAAALALLLLLMAISRKKARKEAEQTDAPLSSALTGKDDSSEPAVSDDFAASALSDADEGDDLFNEDFSFDEPAAPTQFKQEASDPLAEANSYISFGRFSQAAAVLNTAIELEPERTDLRLKLVEVYADLEDHLGFSRQVNDITEIGGAAAELDSLKARYPHMFNVDQVDSVTDDAFAELTLDDITLDSPAPVQQPVADLEAELDDLSALLADAEGQSAAKDEADEFGFDFDLDLAEPTTASVTEAAIEQPAVQDSQDGLDLDLDSFDFDLDKPAAAESADLNDEFSLDDLELDLGDSAVASTDMPSFELPEDFAATPAEEKPTLDFAAQLDEVSAELGSISEDSATDELTAAADRNEFSLDDLDFTTPALEQTDTAASAETVADVDEFSLDDLDFAMPSTAADSATDISEFSLDDLDFGDEPAPTAAAAETAAVSEASLDEFSLDDLDFAPTTETAAAPEQLSVEPEPASPITAATGFELSDLDELGSVDDDFSFLSGTDETATKLDLARAYIDMGDAEGARDILDEVISEGSAAQQDEARDLISQIG